MSDTPRTDALMAMQSHECGPRIGDITEAVVINFACELERELAKASDMMKEAGMDKPMYEALDNAILAAIRGGADKFYLINAAVEALSRPHTKPPLHLDGFRVVDRRLQALSKRRLIRYWRGKWEMRST